MLMKDFIKKLENGNIEKTTVKSLANRWRRSAEVARENKVVFGDNFRMM